MQNAAYGIFRNGHVIFNEPVTAPDDSKVIVVFLDMQKKAPTQNRNALMKLFDALGSWEDSKDTETIISEIEESRVSRAADTII